MNNLLNGKADFGTSSKVGVMTSILQNFLEYKASAEMARKLDMSFSDLQNLLNYLGKQGAVGYVVSMISHNYRRPQFGW